VISRPAVALLRDLLRTGEGDDVTAGPRRNPSLSVR
jgi:hypothetical protein